MRELSLAALVCGLFAGSALAGPLGYASTGSGQFGLVDLSNGNFTLIGSLTASLVGLGESGNVLYGLDSTGNLVAIDKTNAAATQLGNLGIAATVFSSSEHRFAVRGRQFVDALVDRSRERESDLGRDDQSQQYGAAGVGRLRLCKRPRRRFGFSLFHAGSLELEPGRRADGQAVSNRSRDRRRHGDWTDEPGRHRRGGLHCGRAIRFHGRLRFAAA